MTEIPKLLKTEFNKYELVWNWSFLSYAYFLLMTGHVVSMDTTFLNNDVQICMYPTHFNMWRAAGLLIIPTICLFVLTSLRVSFLMRQTWYSAGLCSMVAASPLVHLWGMEKRSLTKIYWMPLPPPSLPLVLLSLSFPASYVFLNLCFCVSEAIKLTIGMLRTGTARRGWWRWREDDMKKGKR